MSGIYIPDMEMPFSCGGCKLVQRYRYSDECQYLHKKIAHNGRLKDCPLVEVPPHGELCDKDKLKEATKKYSDPKLKGRGLSNRKGNRNDD